eukprot:scaffold124085_cov21-Tisochrysis_lutea.AAC.1
MPTRALFSCCHQHGLGAAYGERSHEQQGSSSAVVMDVALEQAAAHRAAYGDAVPRAGGGVQLQLPCGPAAVRENTECVC